MSCSPMSPRLCSPTGGLNDDTRCGVKSIVIINLLGLPLAGRNRNYTQQVEVTGVAHGTVSQSACRTSGSTAKTPAARPATKHGCCYFQAQESPPDRKS